MKNMNQNSIFGSIKILNILFFMVFSFLFQQSVHAKSCNFQIEETQFLKRHLPTRAKDLVDQGYTQLSDWGSIVLIEKTKMGPQFNIDILNSISDVRLRNSVLAQLKKFEFLDVREIYINMNSFCTYFVRTPDHGVIEQSEISFLINSHFVDSSNHQVSKTLSGWNIKPLNSTLVLSGKIILSSVPYSPWRIRINGYDDSQWIERIPRGMVIGGTKDVLEYVKLFVLSALKNTLPTVASPSVYRFLDIIHTFQEEDTQQSTKLLL
ncbi:MAG TPA: hypothetical protein PLJ21_07940 [Pseudobdellovibrionaceae bacterium]|nr:hypothetical protein [Pseudobdellovibrionaceae bacterium]